MRYAVIGTGAIGGYYGAMLARAGNEVHFLLHSDYTHVVAHGLQVMSCDGDFVLPRVHAHQSTATMPQVDVVLVGLKSVNNHLLDTLLPPLLKADTIVVLIQNGIGLESDLQERFPQLHIVSGLAFICSAKTEPGVIRHQCYGNINLGNYSCPDEERLALLVREMKAAGIGTALVEYQEARWKKAVWNMPFNGMTVALNTTTDQLLAHPSTRMLIRQQMSEVVGAAQALGVTAVTEDFADKMIENTLRMVPYAPSMKLDYDYHRPMEITYLYSRPIAEAAKVGFRMPQLEMLEAELKFLEKKELQR